MRPPHHESHCYDFPGEIVAYCQYQIENHKRCVAGKKALIVLDFIDTWVIVNGQYTPAQGSAVSILAKALGDYGIKGVTVTGSNENVGAEQPATMVREQLQG